MSPTKRVGESDPNRGTAPEAITPGRYEGQVAIVTGAGSGIGRATARRLAAEGAAVACLDLAEDAIERGGGRDQPGGGRSRRARRRAALRRHRRGRGGRRGGAGRSAELGEITNLCNIAGIGGFAHTPEQSLSGWEKIIAVNLTGTFLMCRAVLPGMIEHGGAIVNTVSTAGVIGQPYSAAYCASKGGVKMLTKALAVEYMARGVRVNGVAPGGVDTPIIHNFGPPEDADWKLIERLMTPIGFAYPHEIAGAFAYLGSHEADYVTGAILSIDGAIIDLSDVRTPPSRACGSRSMRHRSSGSPPASVSSASGALDALASRPGVEVRGVRRELAPSLPARRPAARRRRARTSAPCRPGRSMRCGRAATARRSNGSSAPPTWSTGRTSSSPRRAARPPWSRCTTSRPCITPSCATPPRWPTPN